MKRLVFTLAILISLPSFAAEMDNKMKMGIDFALPYVVSVDGSTSAKGRANFNIGVDGRYMMTENWNFGARFSFDAEKRAGSTRQIALTPGVQYHWMPGEMWMPFIRADLPVMLRGAANNVGSTSKQDIGIGAGAGIAWNLGDAIGVENMMLRYDFDFAYTFGMGDALPVFGIEFFKIGFDYTF